jgi:hypothetical protein
MLYNMGGPAPDLQLVRRLHCEESRQLVCGLLWLRVLAVRVEIAVAQLLRQGFDEGICVGSGYLDQPSKGVARIWEVWIVWAVRGC